jgi:hypothetical protein
MGMKGIHRRQPSYTLSPRSCPVWSTTQTPSLSMVTAGRLLGRTAGDVGAAAEQRAGATLTTRWWSTTPRTDTLPTAGAALTLTLTLTLTPTLPLTLTPTLPLPNPNLTPNPNPNPTRRRRPPALRWP